MYLPNEDHRALALFEWLSGSLGLDIESFTPASSDASFRRYFRVHHAEGCHVVMDAPPDRETTEPFVRVANLFKELGIHVPKIHQQQIEKGFLLLEDLGSDCYLDVLNKDNVDGLYERALASLFQLQTKLNIADCGLPHYDHALLWRELGVFHEWFLEKLLGIVLPPALRQTINNLLIDSALEQPFVAVHRDYHCRNLMYLGNESPGIIDFQDAVVGPVTYDLVSLLRDCYIAWPEERVWAWCEDYYSQLCEADVVDVEFSVFRRWFDWMGLQRHLKAIGIFSRLHLRDDKPGYLADIPRTMAYVTSVCRRYPELKAFDAFLQHQVLPIYQSHL
jgi:aminoglycoside/choline kinase family phosphotransferase